MKKLKKYLKGFTLVELIIVITILAILATIAFVSFQGYMKDARDSSRLSTFSNLNNGLEVFFTKVGSYPQPDSSVSYTGGNTTIQMGIVGENISKLIGINTIPKDPLTNQNYIYSLGGNGYYYQIAGEKENPQASIFTSVYAAGETKLPIVKGNYKMDPSLPSLIPVKSSVTSSGIFDPNVCFITDGGSNNFSSTSSNCLKKKDMSLKDFDNSLVGYWSFDESGFIPSSNPYSGTGFYKDYSGNEHHAFNSGTIQGAGFVAPTQTGGYIGKGLYFTSGSLILGSDSNFNLKNNFTLSVITKEISFKNIFPRIFDSRGFLNYMSFCSFNPTESICPELILKGGGDYNILFGVYGSGVSMEDRTIKGNQFLKLGEYIKLDFTFSDDTTNTYINGVLHNTFQNKSFQKNPFGTGTLSQESIRIGGSISSRTRDFHGIIDDVKIYNRALSDQEIAQQAKIAGF